MNPLFQFMYPSMANFDISRGTPESMMNTFGNFMLADWQARPLLYMTPLLNFSNVFQYPQLGGNFQLPNSNGFGSIFDFNPPKMDNTTFGQFNFGLPFGLDFGNKPKTKTGDKPETAEDYEKKENVDKLYEVLDNIMKNTTISDSSVKAKVKNALDHYNDNDADLDAQLKVLKEAFKAIPESKVEKYLLTSAIGDEFVNDLLRDAGYENAETRNEFLKPSTLESFKKGIEDLTDASNDNLSEDLTGYVIKDANTIAILDLVSAWNTNYPEKNIIDLLGDKYNNLSGDNKKKVYQRINYLVGALLDKADKVIKTEIDDELALSKTKIANIKALSKELKDAVSIEKNAKLDVTALKDAFNNMYVALRRAQTEIVQQKVNKQYAFLGDDFNFAKDLFTKATEEDLKAEGLEEAGQSEEVSSESTDESADSNSGTDKANDKAKKKKEEAEKTTKQMGADVYRRLHKWTTKTDSEKVNEALGKLNKDDIMAFLDGYWGANGGKKAHEGIIEIMDDDNAGHKITFENKKKFINLIVEKAEALGITEENNNDLAEIKRLMSQFEGYGPKVDKDNFNTSWDPEGRVGHRGVRGFWKTLTFGFHTNYNERLDKHINHLYKEMKEAQKAAQ